MTSRMRFVPAWALLATMLAAGCGTKIVVQGIPSFYRPELKALAVLPFRNLTNVQGAGEIVADKLAAALAANGTYKVYNRNDLKSLMNERDLQLALSDDPAKAATRFKKVGGLEVQAVLTGSVGTFSATTNSQQRQEPTFIYDENGNAIPTGQRVFTWTRNEANVGVTAVLYSVGGETLHAATPSPAQAWAEGSPAKYDAAACREHAVGNMVQALVVEFAVTNCVIKINPSKDFRTSNDLFENQWTYADTFKATDEKMFVVLRLPACCDRNRFRITIARKDQRTYLVDMPIVWDKTNNSFGYQFSPRELAKKGGTGQYVAKFFAGPQPSMTTAFTITP